MTFDNIFLPFITTAADVSSQLVSMPNIVISFNWITPGFLFYIQLHNSLFRLKKYKKNMELNSMSPIGEMLMFFFILPEIIPSLHSSAVLVSYRSIVLYYTSFGKKMLKKNWSISIRKPNPMT